MLSPAGKKEFYLLSSLSNLDSFWLPHESSFVGIASQVKKNAMERRILSVTTLTMTWLKDVAVAAKESESVGWDTLHALLATYGGCKSSSDIA